VIRATSVFTTAEFTANTYTLRTTRDATRQSVRRRALRFSRRHKSLFSSIKRGSQPRFATFLSSLHEDESVLRANAETEQHDEVALKVPRPGQS